MCSEQAEPGSPGIDAALVAALVAAQFPQWASAPVTALRSTGTDHVMYRLADDKVVRLPRTPGVARQVETEQRWLPRLAPHLPLQVPVLLGRGVPSNVFPMPFSVYAWLDGDNAIDHPVVDLRDAAIELGGFVAALRRVEATGGPRSPRGGPLSTSGYDARPAIDLMPGNLLTHTGRLTGVIDFGVLGVGDAACDLIPAWYLFGGDHRDLFRTAADVDDGTWARGRGWALCLGLGAELYYRTRSPALAAVGRMAAAEALNDWRETG